MTGLHRFWRAAAPWFRPVLGLFAAAAVCVLLVVCSSWLLRGRMVAAPERTADEVAAVLALREAQLETHSPPRIHRVWREDIDYDPGTVAARPAWWPRSEAPVIAELVAEGKLPPIERRLGVELPDGSLVSEPIVMEGLAGPGEHGGTWYRLTPNAGDLHIANWRMAGATFVRWNVQADRLVPHLAKGWDIEDDGRTFTIHLRRGARWSDGKLFTAADVLFAREAELASSGNEPAFLKQRGKDGRLETVPLAEPIVLEGREFTYDPWLVRFRFPEPHGSFLASLTTSSPFQPEHYLRPYHPKLGDPNIIAAKVKEMGAASGDTMYAQLANNHFNPEIPRLQAYIYRRHVDQGPWIWVRNPWFPAVDGEGRQLPYIDQVAYKQVDRSMITLSAAEGEATFQLRHLQFSEYTYLMSKRRDKGYEVYHWFPATRSEWCIFPNLNRHIDPDDPSTTWKHRLLNQADFRRALSLAINRQGIIDAEFNGQGEPGQLEPGRGSPFHSLTLLKAWTDYDPARANALLDGIGLTEQDGEGMRTFPDGSRMAFFINLCDYSSIGPAQFVVDDWAAVGVRAIVRNNARVLFTAERLSLRHDFTIWSGESENLPLDSPRSFVPVNGEASWAIGYGRWYALGGLDGDPRADDPQRAGAIAPDPADPTGAVILDLMRILRQAQESTDLARQRELMARIFAINAEQCFTINIATPPPSIAVVDATLRNVPRVAVNAGTTWTPVNAGFETWWFDDAAKRSLPPSTYADLQLSMTTIRSSWGGAAQVSGAAMAATGSNWGGILATVIRWLLLGSVVLGIGLVAFRHPFVLRRLLWMIPTLAIMSIIIFTVIQMPPGDFITNRLEELRMEGDTAAIAQMEAKREFYNLDESVVIRYFRWVGLSWFVGSSASAADGSTTWSWPGEPGLIQGHLGYSMQDEQPVNKLVGDRIMLTVALTLGSLIFTWVVALSTGIYAAVRQYSTTDYVLSFLAIIGMCVPNFLLALMLIYLGDVAFGLTVTGLFSPEYAIQDWSFGKVIDLLKHIWVGILVIGVGGTAGMMRIMRGNLLDELKKPYVTTARAKGLRPWRLVLKYPVRLALNPFISGIGGIFPLLVSGSAIVSMVLALPTVGPLLIEGLLMQDMYLAGSLTMVLSLLGVFGTLVSDLLLLWLDPRIRMEGGSR